MSLAPGLSFRGLHLRLVETIRGRVRNGELTERSFARSFGVSQPHLHHVLKGVRLFSAEFADSAMHQLGITIWDLCTEEAVSDDGGYPKLSMARSVPVLRARIGAGVPFSGLPEFADFYPIASSLLEGIEGPIAVRLGADPEVSPRFLENDVLLLDQGIARRANPDPESSYIVNSEGGAVVRYIRRGGHSLYSASDFTLPDPRRWTRISGRRDILEMVRARIVWIGRELAPAPPSRPAEETGRSGRPASVERRA